MSEWTRRALAYQPDSADWYSCLIPGTLQQLTRHSRRLVGLSLGVTVLFVTYILYWNRLLASIICFCLRFATWDKHAPGSFWIEAGQSIEVPHSSTDRHFRVNTFFSNLRTHYTT